MNLARQAGKDRPERGGGFDNERQGNRDDDHHAGRSDAGDRRRGPPPPSRDDGRDRDRAVYWSDKYEKIGYRGPEQEGEPVTEAFEALSM